jgi:ribosomal protein S20
MALQFRKGQYEQFDPNKLLPGEMAVVLSGDPATSTGRSVYICFEPGAVKRFVTYEDFETELQAATAELQQEFSDTMQQKIDTAVTEAVNAANKAANAASSAAEAANTALENANNATERANKAAAACEGIAEGTKVTELEGQMQQVIETLGTVISTE